MKKIFEEPTIVCWQWEEDVITTSGGGTDNGKDDIDWVVKMV